MDATAAELWLADRDAEVPAALREEMRAAVRQVPEDGETGVALRLAAAAAACLRRAVDLGVSREGAWPLLAADALLTYACEAAADAELAGHAGTVAALCRRIGPAGLETLVAAERVE
jgi:hypothetical protein